MTTTVWTYPDASASQDFTEVDTAFRRRALLRQFMKPNPLIETQRRRIAHAYFQVNARRAESTHLPHALLHHSMAITLASRPFEQVDVQVRRKGSIGLRTKIIRTVVTRMDRLRTRPCGWIACGHRKPSAKGRPPFPFVPTVKRARVQCPQGIAAHALIVLDRETQLGLEDQIGANIDSAQSVGIVGVEWLAILAVIACFETDVIHRALVGESRGANGKFTH